MKFEQFGVLCRHVFTVMRSYNIKKIPSKYLLRRWQNGIIPSIMLRKTFRYAGSNEGVERLAIGIFSSVDNVISSLSNDENKLEEFLHDIHLLESKFLTGISITEKPDKNKEFEKRLGVTTPDVIEVENPAQVQTKGSGSRKRYKSTLEVSTQKGRKGTRCSYCRNSNEHDWRNCPDRKKDVSKGIIKKRPGKSD